MFLLHLPSGGSDLLTFELNLALRASFDNYTLRVVSQQSAFVLNSITVFYRGR